ncbi:hypothetical protein RFI_29761 [Reticulomyxa filosa]|uniref:Protein kinase domain-containing protein n=1 Tax=Reticulomyxa filosa TaxID=46433 RepID=X6M2I5_RETFI|nr:hypothetical protein RFI_29761 [Reticulomyxa filosa]|eukprot:ETO07632.1 hypothetical protein RFI_29761 [Reticulomyxa filosa]
MTKKKKKVENFFKKGCVACIRILQHTLDIVLLCVHHANIVKLYNVFDSKNKMCLVLDLLEGGELFDRIIEQGHFTEKNAAQCFGQLVEALDYLHQRQIAHRDLKVYCCLKQTYLNLVIHSRYICNITFFFFYYHWSIFISMLFPENLLFTKKCKDKNVYVREEWNIKLIDFGLAGSCKYELLKTPCGTPNYVAPEILRKEKYGISVDMWSAGVILYIMLKK